MSENNTTAPALTDEQWLDLASRHANAEWNSTGYLDSIKAVCADFALLTFPRAAVPMTEDARECLMDVVSHHDNIVAGFAAQRNAATDADDSGDIAYWNHEINVAHRMQEQAKRALDAQAPAATVAETFARLPLSAEHQSALVWAIGRTRAQDELALADVLLEILNLSPVEVHPIGSVRVDLIRSANVSEVSEPVLTLSSDFEAAIDMSPGTEFHLYASPIELYESRAAVSPAPVAADGAATKDDVDALTFALGASVMIEGGEKYREALKRMLDRERAAVSPATAALPIKIPHVHIRPEDEEIGRQYYALGFVDGNRSITDAPQPARVVAPKPATADERTARDDGFFAGVCVALQVITAFDQGVMWAELVRACGTDELLQYAAHVEPEEWQLAGFEKYAFNELRKKKPKSAARASQAAAPAEAREPDETEQSIAADCYHWIAERIGTKDGYSVQEHVDAMCQVIDDCADFFHDFVGADEGGDDAAVRIAKNIRALKAGTLQDVSVRADAGEAVLAAVDRAVLAQAADFLEQKHSRLAAVTLRALLAQGAQGGKGGEA
ncbi:hypothetical protein [Burkholderia glumae]|uniref:hypothetical protein n=1 Tax=Burkholderia glumae TaxID=337 RepID=UPI0021510277|nr:hypothetical protein [Burkholderia glumae]